jgi:SAM-dependent methyltransferase
MDLAAHREKWREVPGGSDTDGRIFSSDLLGLPDADLLAFWERMAERRLTEELGWIDVLYRDFFAGKRVLDVGSGLGLNGMRFASLGADWVFADIAPGNLKLLRRIAALKGLRPSFHLIGDDLSFDGLGAFDAVFACGSLHHVPFDLARRECAQIARHLKAKARWIELVYPKERWMREGCPAFGDWGRMTDGDRTPWAEWYDADKLRARLDPLTFRTILDFTFREQHFRWLDLERI